MRAVVGWTVENNRKISWRSCNVSIFTNTFDMLSSTESVGNFQAPLPSTTRFQHICWYIIFYRRVSVFYLLIAYLFSFLVMSVGSKILLFFEDLTQWYGVFHSFILFIMLVRKVSNFSSFENIIFIIFHTIKIKFWSIRYRIWWTFVNAVANCLPVVHTIKQEEQISELNRHKGGEVLFQNL